MKFYKAYEMVKEAKGFEDMDPETKETFGDVVSDLGDKFVLTDETRKKLDTTMSDFYKALEVLQTFMMDEKVAEWLRKTNEADLDMQNPDHALAVDLMSIPENLREVVRKIDPYR